MGLSCDRVDRDRCSAPSLVETETRLLADLLTGIHAQDADAAAGLLMQHWTSVPEALAASFERVDAVAGRTVALHVATLNRALAQIAHRSIEDRPLISTSAELGTYLRLTMAYRPVEEMRVFYLSTGHRLLRDELAGQGAVDRVIFEPREIVRRALELRASAIILAHNHPGGSRRPSDADVVATRTLGTLGRPFGIEVIDHVLVTRGRCQSLRASGYL